MGAPSATMRALPGSSNTFATHLDNGHSTKISFEVDIAGSNSYDVSFWEKTVQPPGVDGGDPIDTTTMHNTAWRTMASRSLRTLTPFTVTAAYDPAVYADTQILNLINNEGSITVEFPDGSTLAFFGYLQKFEPDANEEGVFPMATLTIVPTNIDPNDRLEAQPVMVPVAGTG